MPSNLETAIRSVLNSYHEEKESNTPDFILAEYLSGCLDSFHKAVRAREKFYGREIPEIVKIGL